MSKRKPPTVITLEPSPPPRNPLAVAAFKRRAGAHGKSASAIRQTQDKTLRQLLKEQGKEGDNG